MKFEFSLKIAALSLMASTAAAAPVKAPTIEDASCQRQPGDVFETPARFTEFSKGLAGRCLDTDRFRFVRDLKIEGGKISFSNYYFKGEYWKAEAMLDENAIEMAIFHVARFPVVKAVEAAHTQIRFKFKADHPVKLVNQKSGDEASANEIMISFEGGLDPNGKYNFAMGAFDTYAIIGRVGDTRSFLAQKKMKSLEQYELDISNIERQELLVSLLQRSEKIAGKNFYNTLRPNCTTEIFDRIDDLHSLKNRFPRFLTVLSNDPIAGPSIEGLQARGILKRRIQDIGDEVEGQVAKTLVTPKSKSLLPEMIPAVDGSPWSLVITNPDETQLSEIERQTLKTLRTEISERALRLLQAYGSAALVDKEKKKGSELFLKTIADLQRETQATLSALDSRMPIKPQNLAVYIVPMKADSARTSLESIGLQVAVPLNIRSHVIEDAKPGSKEVYFWISEGAMRAADVGSKASVPAYLMSAAIVLSVEKGKSVVTTQAMIGLNAVDKAFESKNDQVELDTVRIARGNSRSERPVLVVSHRQELRAPLNPNISLEFGASGGLAGSMDHTRAGTLQIWKPVGGVSCEHRASASPALTGVFGSAPTKIALVNKLLKGKPVAFQITKVEMNLEKIAIEEMDVNINTWPVKCASTSDVDKQFAAQADQSLAPWREKIKSQGQMILDYVDLITNR